MKKSPRDRTNRALARLFWKCLPIIVGSALLGPAAPSLLAEATVQTLGGGRLSPTGPDAGFTDGDILQASQFNTPSGCAVDASGRVYVADRNNGAVRRLDLAASRCRTLVQDLQRPVAVVVDTNDVLYVLTEGDGGIRRLETGQCVTLTTGLNSPTALAYDGVNSFYVTQGDGTVVRVNATDGGISAPIISGLRKPAGLALLDNGFIAVSESSANLVSIWDPQSGTLQQQIGIGTAGCQDGSVARFFQPAHLAKTPGGGLLVADRGNHRLRFIAPNSVVSTVYGVDPATWEGPACTGCTPIILPGWLDGSAEFAEAREPVGVTVGRDGRIFTTEVFYHLVRQVTGADLAARAVVLPPVMTPSSGYFPMGQTITVTNPNSSSFLSTAVYYTTDGSEPTTNSFRLELDNGVGTLFWQEKDRDLSMLRLKAFVGTQSSAIISGVPVTVSEIGVPQDIPAGMGSTAIIPIVMNLRTNDRIQSLQFRVEVTPESETSPMIPERFRALDFRTNDFIALFTSESKGTFWFSEDSYSFGRTRGLAISCIGSNANLLVKDYGVAAMVAVPIPPGARAGDRYSISVINPSATADAMQQRVALSAMPERSIVVAHTSYLVGDSASGTWYNAAQLDPSGALRPGFGDGLLENSDVNNVFYASAGIRLPYPESDVFDAMDAFPEDTAAGPGGDGLIRFLDWQLVLRRALGLDPARWVRTWSDGGVRSVNGLTTTDASSLTGQTVAAPKPGAVWTPQACLSGQSLESLAPNVSFDVPIYIQAAAGCELAGLEFRAAVEPEGTAPPMDRPIEFIVNPNLPGPTQHLTPGLGTVVCGWPLVPSSEFQPPLRGSQLLGHIRVALPAAAHVGQVYTLRFYNADGAPDLQTQYQFETKRVSLWVGGPAARPADVTSDEWKAQFFGSSTAPTAAPEADPDHDGVPNWLEYLSGTNPTDPKSYLRLDGAAMEKNSGGVALRWLSAPGKVYQIESASALSGGTWTAIASNLSGTGDWQQFVHLQPGGDARFYRIRLQP